MQSAISRFRTMDSSRSKVGIVGGTVRRLMLLLAASSIEINAANECAPRHFDSDSFVCVCNATYCDSVGPWPKPEIGTVLSYTTSKVGYRFQQGKLPFNAGFSHCSRIPVDFEVSICIDSRNVKQGIVGFGGSFTDATAINIQSLTPDVQQKLKESYFSETGLEYNLFRVPIGGSDCSTRPYSYDDDSYDDFAFENFTLQMEDHQYKIPLIHDAQNMSNRPIKLVATSWSPPVWMKTSNSFKGPGWLKGETGGQYYDAYARYFLRFLKEYRENGIEFWGLTTQNEPPTGFLPFYPFNNLGMTPDMLHVFVKKNIGPQLRASEFNATKLLIFDYERISLLPYVATILDDSDASKYVDGIANHWYSDNILPPFVLDVVHNMYPQKPMLMTEASITKTFTYFGKPVLLGSWQRANTYAYYMIQNLQHWITGWIDWNMALNPEGGPNWAKNFLDAPIIVNNRTNEFYKQPLYFVMGHFSKFVLPGSVIIESKQSWFSRGISSVAFRTPESFIVLIVLNRGPCPCYKHHAPHLQLVAKTTAPKTCFNPFADDVDEKVTLLCFLSKYMQGAIGDGVKNFVRGDNKDVSMKINELNVGSFTANIPANALLTFIWKNQ